MDKFKEIRPVALGIAVRDGKILASRGYDKIKQKHFYRPIGGGIEFLEKSDTTLKREFMEEIQADITVDKFLGICENIFTFNGQRGHELILLYAVTVSEKNYKEQYCIEGNIEDIVDWVDINLIKNGEITIYPTEVTNYI